jgi:hypothetical protein
MIVYFWHKSKTGKLLIAIGLSVIGIYCLFIYSKILKMDVQTLQIVQKRSSLEPLVLPVEVNLQNPEDAFVASKRGKYYYPKNCDRAKSLSVQNMLYFKDKMSAEAAGFKAFLDC